MIDNLKKYAIAGPGQRSSAGDIKPLNHPQHYQSLFDLNLDAIFSLDRNGYFTSANESLLKLAEIGMSDLLEMNFRQFCTPQDIEKAELRFENASMGCSQRFTLNVLTARGNPLYLEASVIPLLIEGDITGVYCIIKKTSPPKNSRAEIERITGDLNRMIKASADIICTIDRKGDFVRLSGSSERICGYKPVELIGKPYIHLIHEDDKARTLLTAGEIISGKVVTNFENRYVCKDGSIRSMIWSARWNPKDESMYCVAQNITAQREAEQKYQNLFNINPQAMWIFDVHTLEFLDVNEAAIRLYGYSRAEFLSMNISQIRPPEDVKLLQEILNQVKTEGGFHQSVVRHLKKSGGRIDLQIESNLIDYKGRSARIVLAIDITAKLKAEYSLELSEQRFKALVQNGTDLISILDSNGFYKYVNPTSIDLLGIEPEALIGKNAFDFIHPQDKERVAEEFSLLQTQRRLQVQPFRFKNVSGNYRWIETNITNLLDNPSVNGFVSNSRDVTERMEGIEKIRKSEEKTNLIMNAALDAIICIDRQGRITFWNPQAEKIFGWMEEQVKGKILAALIAPVSGLRPEREGVKTTCEPGELPELNCVWEQNAVNKNHAEFPIELIVVPIQQEHEQFFCVFIRDITDQKAHIKFIEDQNQRLREIAWTQSHIVRAPLARIIGLVSMIKSNPEKSDNMELIDYLNESARELDLIIKDIVDKTRKIDLG